VVSRERTFVATSTLNETTTVDGLTWAQQTNFGTRTVVYSPPNRQNITLRFDTQGRLERIEPYAQYPVCISYSGHRVSSVRQGNFATCATTAPPVRRAVSFGYGTGSLRWLEEVTVGHTATTLLTDLTPSANRGLVTSALLPGRTQQSFFEYDADDRLRRVAPAGHYTGTKPPAAASDNGAVRRRTSAVAQGRSSLARSTSCLVVSVGVAPTTLKRLASPTIQTSSV
jgi:hypothetical protein